MASRSPALSVIIPTRNRAETLGKALNAYAAQTLSPDEFEILVVDDGSTDSTPEAVNAIAKKQKNMRCLRQEEGGPAKARNLGIKNARGEILLITGDDCIPAPSLLEEHLRSHGGNRAIAVLGLVDWHPDVPITPFMEYVGRTFQFTYSNIRTQRRSVRFGFFYTSNISLPKSLLERGFFFDEDFPYAAWEDVELGYRLWKEGIRIEYNPKAVTYHCHEVDFKSYLQRQLHAGLAAAIYFMKHPEAEELLEIQSLIDPRCRMIFYESALKYYYLYGLQMGLSGAGRVEKRFIVPLEDRLVRWSSELNRKLLRKYQSAREESKSVNAILGEHAWNMKKLQRAMAESSRVWEEERKGLVHARDAERGRREAAEAELNRIRSGLSYRLYAAARGLIGKGKK